MNTGTDSPKSIELRGVRVHNLRGIDLDLPLGKLIVVTGVSGAGKSSLAFDTLYAEGQRRYVESFPTDSRRFLERLDAPAADSIGRIPPAVAVRQSAGAGSRRATLASATEVLDHLRLLYARAGVIVCPECGIPVRSTSPSEAARLLSELPPQRIQIGFSLIARSSRETEPDEEVSHRLARWTKTGFTRAVVDGQALPLAELHVARLRAAQVALVILDRLQVPSASLERLTDSLETAFREGDRHCVALLEGTESTPLPLSSDRSIAAVGQLEIEGKTWQIVSFHEDLVCGRCQREFPILEPALFNASSPLGACPACGGSGVVNAARDAADSSLGSVAGQPANGESNDARPPHPRPFPRQGGREKGFQADAEPRICPECHGDRLNSGALAVRIGGRNLPELNSMTVDDAREFLSVGPPDSNPVAHSPDSDLHEASRAIVDPIMRRLEFLREVGLGYLTLDRPLRSLSRGEAQRAKLAGACGSNLVNLLYVLDEPTAGLHPRDTERLIEVLLRLRDAGNTVVAVEHDPAVIGRADWLVDLGPHAAEAGGRVVYQGPPAAIATCAESITGDFFAGRRNVVPAAREPREPSGWIDLCDVHHRNLHGVNVSFPLGVLCVVSGVSGSGKSSLVVETLVPAVEAALERRGTGDAERERGTGIDSLDAVLLLDAQPIGRSPRSQPAGFLGIFAEIRTLFAGTAEAKVKNLAPRHFSFNAADGGRCAACAGAGTIAVDMQFLPDITMTCPDCHGTRFRREILDVKYRGLSIAEVLALTAQEAFLFFRGRTRIQRRLKHMKDVGLDYVRLGQPARTLSGGESQRLKLAAFLARGGRSRTLIVQEEPTTGLHPQDVARLIDCWNNLLAAGHSLLVIEHNLDVLAASDHVIDLGPDAGPAGGTIVAIGTPKDIAATPASITGRYLARRKGP